MRLRGFFAGWNSTGFSAELYRLLGGLELQRVLRRVELFRVRDGLEPYRVDIRIELYRVLELVERDLAAPDHLGLEPVFLEYRP